MGTLVRKDISSIQDFEGETDIWDIFSLLKECSDSRWDVCMYVCIKTNRIRKQEGQMMVIAGNTETKRSGKELAFSDAKYTY